MSEWSEAEAAYLRTCVEKKMSLKRIMQQFKHRSGASIKAKIERARADRGRKPVSKIFVPPTVIAERDKRLNEPRTLGQILMGDPPESQSALKRHPGNGAD